jgi:N-acetylneuraminate synthase
MYGSDQAASIEVGSLANFVESIRKIPLIMGDGIKLLTDKENAVRSKLRVQVQH